MSQQQAAENGAKARPPHAPRGVSPLNGQPVPAGRAKGQPNRLTRSLREAVERAARECHPNGLAGWLIERAQGNIADRQIFAGLVGKVIPLQVKASVEGGITLNLGWLQQRNIGASASQLSDRPTQVIDVTPEPRRVQMTASLTPAGEIALEPVRQAVPATLAAAPAADPPPPVEPGAGGPPEVWAPPKS